MAKTKQKLQLVKNLGDHEYKCPKCKKAGLSSRIIRHSPHNLRILNGMIVEDCYITCTRHSEHKFFDGKEITLERVKAPTRCPWCGKENLKIIKAGLMTFAIFVCMEKECESYFTIDADSYKGLMNHPSIVYDVDKSRWEESYKKRFGYYPTKR